MTTQTDVTRPKETMQVPAQINKPVLQFVIAALLIIAIITAAYLAISTREGVVVSNNRVMEAQAARYQGLADLFAEKEIALERNWSASAARYQGLADFYTFSKLSPASKASAARYQGLADEHAANKAALERGWDASAARYQGLVEYFEANGK